MRIAHAAAIGVLGDALGHDVIEAGTALGVLDEDRSTGEVTFRHQLLQEYFAARELGRCPEPERLTTHWRVTDIRPGLREVLESLPPADVLPTLPATGWEETAVLAAAMMDHPEPFLRGLMAHNLVVAGRAARRDAVRARLDAAFLDELRWALVGRSRDPEADLRARVAGRPAFRAAGGAAGRVLGSACGGHSGRGVPDRGGRADRGIRTGILGPHPAPIRSTDPVFTWPVPRDERRVEALHRSRRL